MNIRLSGIQNDSIVDGPGLRLSVFTQGCPHRCEGCHNPDTHDPLGGYAADTDDIIALMDKNPLLSGLTLTGGEPFGQPSACLALAEAAAARGLSTWIYTGYTLEALRAMDNAAVSELLATADVLVDGRFILAARSLELRFCGSSNQRLIDLKRTGNGDIVLWKDPWEQLF